MESYSSVQFDSGPIIWQAYVNYCIFLFLSFFLCLKVGLLCSMYCLLDGIFIFCLSTNCMIFLVCSLYSNNIEFNHYYLVMLGINNSGDTIFPSKTKRSAILQWKLTELNYIIIPILSSFYYNCFLRQQLEQVFRYSLFTHVLNTCTDLEDFFLLRCSSDM